ncbi:hypothetical protein K1719_024829 [Acacia pycnantha]|nr:hypothetical protein K1719_024829 [Acacia pycnantha]
MKNKLNKHYRSLNQTRTFPTPLRRDRELTFLFSTSFSRWDCRIRCLLHVGSGHRDCHGLDMSRRHPSCSLSNHGLLGGLRLVINGSPRK